MSLRLENDTYKFTYDDYCLWDGPERFELIEGIPYSLAAPIEQHNTIIGQIFAYSILYFERNGHPCKPLFAPQELKLDLNKKHDTVVEPDFMVKCGNPPKYMPIWVVEVLSPTTAYRDKGIKRQLYRENGVLEYWIIDPEKEKITVYDFVLGSTTIYDKKKDKFISPISFPDCIMEIDKIFDYYNTKPFVQP